MQWRVRAAAPEGVDEQAGGNAHVDSILIVAGEKRNGCCGHLCGLDGGTIAEDAVKRIGDLCLESWDSGGA